ncbi:oligosaccharide repeat unit polymerase [Seonamhaeicola sediminis]|uniref:Oligosaccharide repeat unit polymerase n=1 Tax=Seonamhaeicola sediminis TaxID=2528206 RepID=A0A562YGP1_9FLAO|nr:O-antigen polymerase [Seonamhaeicola sediminis]TWO33982.1 oligosaccharide repeat unit polymerase [Seonamhaeicola sediminis]
MIFYLFFLILVFVLAFVNNKISKKIFYPPLYLCFLWIFFVFLHLIYNLLLSYKPNVLSAKVLSYFLCVILLFSFGGIIARGLNKNRSNYRVKMVLNKRVLKILFYLNIVFFLKFILTIKSITGSYFDLLLFRYYTSVEGVDIGLIKYSITFAVFSMLLFLTDFYNRDIKSLKLKIRLGVMFLIAFSFAVLSASRGTFLFLLISCLGVYSIYNKINIKLVLKTVGITLAIFITMATIMKKSMPNEHNSSKSYSAIDKVEYLLYSYGSLPLSAFDKFLNESYTITYGDILLRFPKAILYKVGVSDTSPGNLVERYVKVPDLVNVHTAFYKLIKDFGVIYSLLFMFLIGFLHTHFFIGANKSFGKLIGYSTMLFPLTMTFFEENYVSILSTWIQLGLFVYMAKYFIKYEY